MYYLLTRKRTVSAISSSLQRWQCPSYPWNHNLSKKVENNVFFSDSKYLFLRISLVLLISKKCASYSCREPANEKKQFKDNITFKYIILYQKKFIMVPLWIGHCHLCVDDYWNQAYNPFREKRTDLNELREVELYQPSVQILNHQFEVIGFR